MTEDRDPSGALLALALQVVERACRAGADVAEVSLESSLRLGARVRLDELDLLEEAGRRALDLRVIREGRVGIASTTDLSDDGLGRAVTDALQLAELTEPDELAGPADPAWRSTDPLPQLDLFDPELDRLEADAAIRYANDAERAAVGFDPRLTLSEGSRFERASSCLALALSSGFSAAYRSTEAALCAAPAAEDADGKRRMGNHFTAHRHLGGLQDAQAVGREAARRALAKLGARRVPTAEVPVVFAPDASRSLLARFASCILGDAVWRKATYLADRLGTTVASPLVTIVDDPRLPRGLGSRPFDGEGLHSPRHVVVAEGELQTFLLDCHSARRLGRAPTGSAARTAGNLSASTSNFVLQPGATRAEHVVSSTSRGLYVTELLGFGFDPVTGDYSQGAAGFWIEGGELAFPVSEITVSSNLDRMLHSVDAVGDDLGYESAMVAPTVRIARMTVGGS